MWPMSLHDSSVILSKSRTEQLQVLIQMLFQNLLGGLFNLFDHGFKFIKMFQHVLNKVFVGLATFFAQG